MNIKSFFATAISSALELGLATSEDVLHHVTPDVLATHLPRPLWSRLLTACIGATKVDATLVVETIGVPNLCEHVPVTILWACIAEIGTRSLAGTTAPRVTVALSPPPPALAAPPPPIAASSTAATSSSSSVAAAATPTPTPTSHTSSGKPIPPPSSTTSGSNGTASNAGTTSGGEPLAALVAELEAEDRAAPNAPLRPRTSTRPPFRQTTTGIGRLANTKRPQATVVADAPASASTAGNGLDGATERGGGPPARPPRRGQTEADSFEIETDVRREPVVPVDDEQLVDWSASEETAIGPDFDRKR